jgi:hypothetical protein
MAAPAWKTEELQDEWVDLELEDNSQHESNLSFGTNSLSLTVPLPSHIHTYNDLNNYDTPTNASQSAAGTFLIRDDIPNAPFQPKTPGGKMGSMKDIFTPLALERMFEPPLPKTDLPPDTHAQTPSPRTSPPHGPAAYPRGPLDMLQVASFNQRKQSDKQSIGCQFTFTVPRQLVSHRTLPQAQSTPTPPVVLQPKAPATDSRLRLFQFQYDTYTREHLSALVDSIAINTPSGTGTSPSPTSFTHHLSRVTELTGPGSLVNAPHLRSAKRVKLSPLSEYYGEGVGSQAVISRPKLTGKDYVGESRQLMQQIKSARDFSTISTNVTTPPKSSPLSQGIDPIARAHAPSPISPGEIFTFTNRYLCSCLLW